MASAITTGSLAATGSVTHYKLESETSTLVQVSGTYGTLVFVIEGTYDGSVWVPLAATSKKTGALVTGSITPTDNDSLQWVVDSTHLSAVRTRVTSIASGTAAFALKSGSYLSNQGPLTVSTSGTLGASTYTGDVLLNDSVKLKLGDASDITVAWDGTDLDVLQATPNSSIKWGVDGAGIDQVFYGDTASTNVTWDQSADSLILNGAVDLVFTGATGEPEVALTDNLADALSVKIPSGVDLLVLTTTNSAEAVAVRGLRTTSSTGVAITGATTLTLADSGGIFTVSQAAAYDIDLPSPTTGPGCSYFFSLTAPGANNVTLTVAGSAATFVGSITIDGATVVATGSTLTFATGASLLGDSIEVRSIATNLYHVRAIASGTGGITIA